MDRIKITNLYERIIESIDITKDVLYACGFSDSEINELIEDKIIGLQNGVYTFLDVNSLYRYAEELKDQGFGPRASICIKRCKKIDPFSNYRTLYRMLIQKEFRGSVLFIKNKFDEFELSDVSQYLFMINYISFLPSDLNDFVMKFIRERKKSNELTENEKALFDYKFSYAKSIRNKEEKGYKESLLLFLINSCIKRRNSYKQQVLDLVQDKKFAVLQKRLEEEQKVRGLSDIYLHILMVLQDLDQCMTSGEVPEVWEDDVTHTFQAIECGMYKKALELLDEFSQKCKIDELSMVLRVVLEELIKYVESIELGDINQEEDLALGVNYQEILEVLVTGNFSFLEVQKQFELNDVQLAVLKLVCAKAYYSACMMDIGDTLVSEVRKADFNSEVIHNLLDEVYIVRENGIYANVSSTLMALKRVSPDVLMRK